MLNLTARERVIGERELCDEKVVGEIVEKSDEEGRQNVLQVDQRHRAAGDRRASQSVVGVFTREHLGRGAVGWRSGGAVGRSSTK